MQMVKFNLTPLIAFGALTSVIVAFGIPYSADGGVKEMAASYAADFSDDRILMGSSHNLFVGKVLRVAGGSSRGFGPETQFSVEIIDVIKGTVQGVVTISQSGGYVDDVLYVMEGGGNSDEYLLRPGSTYILATRYDDQRDWHILIPHQRGKRLVSENSDMSMSELKSQSTRNESVVALKYTYPREILLYADVESGIARNSYQSLHPEATPSLTTRDLAGDSGGHRQEVKDLSIGKGSGKGSGVDAIMIDPPSIPGEDAQSVNVSKETGGNQRTAAPRHINGEGSGPPAPSQDYNLHEI